MRIQKIFLFACWSLLTLIFLGCGDTSSNSSNNNTNTKNPSKETKTQLPETLFVKEPLPNPKSVLEVRKEGKAGEKVTLVGYIGGRKEPFILNRAAFIIVDQSLLPCEEGCCETPWDACCKEEPQTIAKNIANIQIIDKEGVILKTGIQNQGGLAHSTVVTIQGVIHQKDDNTLVVNAEKIHVKTVK